MSSSFGNTLYKIMNELHTPPNPQDIPCSSPNYFIRRTMSADMSSPKWLQQNGFFSSSPSSSSMKRAQSSEQLQALGEEDSQKQSSDEEKKGSAAFEDIWSSIQSEKQSWSSILSQQKNDGSGFGSGSGSVPVPLPYVHPLVRRSTSSLSDKSLEICTESLGSETGSDVFPYPLSDPEDSDKEVEVEVETEDKLEHNNKVVEEEDEVEEVINECDHEIVEEVPKYKNKYYSGSQGIKTAFPPPLPSLAHRNNGDGSNLHIMRSHRHDGRLVLEAVSVPSHNCLRAHRRGGRLLLTLANQQEQESEEEEEEEVIITEEEEKEKEEVTPNGQKNHVHRSSPPTMMIMSKIIGLTSTRNNSTWRHSTNATIIRSLDDHHHHEEEAEKHVSKAASWANSKSSLPPRPKVARRSTTSGPKPKSTAMAVTTLNPYEYYWRQTTAVDVLKPLAGAHSQQVEKENNNSNNKLILEHNGTGVSVAKQGVVVVKAGVVATGEKEAEYLVPFLRGCKEPRRRSLLFWEPYCIATS